MKVFSVLLNIIRPKNKIKKDEENEYAKPLNEKDPLPIKEYLKVSITYEIGLSSRISRVKEPSLTILIGYIIGVANIKSCIPN
tara:strand:- start:169 stop:417 length:249 start_codon:yes stop_codon:yes gene_type:complete